MKKILQFFQQKIVYYSVISVCVLFISGLLAVPSLAPIQSAAQHFTSKHPEIAKIAPSPLKVPNLDVPSTGDWLVIPAAAIKLPIVEGPSIDVLISNVGVWHQTGDLNHNYVIAGHRLQYFRSVNQSLYHLDVLKVGDQGVYVVHNGQAHSYQVDSTKIVPPADVGILDPTTTQRLTIYTCNDFYNHSRLVVTASAVVS